MDKGSITLRRVSDLVEARMKARDLARRTGLGTADQSRFTAAVTELGRNALQYAGGGECRLRDLSDTRRLRLEVEVSDRGPGIVDVELALRDGYSTSGGMGCGLPGVKRSVDVFHVDSTTAGTTVSAQLIRQRAS